MEKIKFLCVIFLCIVSIVSCTRNNEKEYLNFQQKAIIRCDTVPYEDIIGISMQILQYDSMLLINDFRGDSLIHLYDTRSKQLKRKLIPAGNGPNELLSPLEIHFQQKNLFVLARQTSIVYKICSDSLNNGKIDLIKQFQVPEKVNHLYPLTDSIYIASGFFPKRYAIINSLGQKVSEFGDYPSYWDGESNFPVNAKAMFHQTCFEKHSTTSKYVAYSSHVIEIYDYSKNILHPELVKSMAVGNYRYSYVDNGSLLTAKRNDDIEIGIINVACTSQYIYIVYYLDTNSNRKQKIQIRVIDWEGNAVKIIHTDMKINCLIVYEDDTFGYLIARNPDDMVMRFRIEDI
jgi:hypothetical protein